jgi:hypothetical protein
MSKGFAGVTKLILETLVPNEAHAEFDRVVRHGQEAGTRYDGERRSCTNIPGPRRRNDAWFNVPNRSPSASRLAAGEAGFLP